MKMLEQNRRSCFLLFMLLIFLLCGCGRQMEAEYVYPEMPAWEEDDLEELVWVKADGSMYDSLYLYSISNQKIVESYKPECDISAFAVTDSSVYFLTRGELWRINRETGEQEETGITRASRLAAQNGYLFYGDKENIFACRQDGDLQTDAVSLQEQFSQENRPSMHDRAEIVFRGWRISGTYGYHSYYIWGIIDEESGRVILGPENSNYFYSHGGPPDFTGTYTVRGDGVWVTFHGSEGLGNANEPVVYQKDGETEIYQVQCLSEKKYLYSRIGEHFTLEDGKLIGYITVCKGPLFDFLGTGAQDDADYDVLFELDVETNTSKLLYSTEKDQAQIVGYKSGKVYCFSNGRIYRESLADGTRERMLDLREGEWSRPWDDKYSRMDIYWQGDYMIVYMNGEIKSYYIPD